MNIMREKEESIRKIIIEAVAFVITVLAGVSLITVAGLAELETWQRILLIAIAVIVMAGGITVGAMADMSIGTFECKHCGTRFVPSAASYIFGAHTITKRRLTCPKCGKRSYCKHRLTH